MTSVLIVQPYVPAYRVPLFVTLRERAAARGITLKFAAGRPAGEQARRDDAVQLDWVHQVQSWSSPLRGLPLRVKALPARAVAGCDLVIGELSVGAAENWPLAMTRRLCLWGHGYRAIGNYSWLDDVLETTLLRRSRHFFAYTDRGRAHAVARGLPEERITVLWNAVDTAEIREAGARLTKDQIASFRDQFHLGDGPVLASIGGLDASKRIDLLLGSAEELRQRIPDLRLLIAGDGAERETVVAFTEAHPWASWIGRVDAKGKALLAACCSLLINPGRVGLVAVDSFAMATPIATTTWQHHAPEFEYLDSGNALITEDSLLHFVEGVEQILCNPNRLAILRAGCAAAADRFSVEAMAGRFMDGITRALST